jgi:hypothetical protein
MPPRMLFAIVIACVLSNEARAQGPSVSANALGTWRGTSLCLVRPSSCNDEFVVYRVARSRTSGDDVSIDASKMVNGQEEEMGVLTCRPGGPGTQLTCAMKNGVWHFVVRGDSLVGELRLPNNTKFRDVRTVRAVR